MATFKYEVGVPSVLTGVLAKAKAPKGYVFNHPDLESLNMFANMIRDAKAKKGAKNRHGEWEFVMVMDLESKDAALAMRDDVYEINRLADGRNTLRSKIQGYMVNGEELWFFAIRSLTDSELAKKDARKEFKEENKDAISQADLLKIVNGINK